MPPPPASSPLVVSPPKSVDGWVWVEDADDAANSRRARRSFCVVSSAVLAAASANASAAFVSASASRSARVFAPRNTTRYGLVLQNGHRGGMVSRRPTLS